MSGYTLFFSNKQTGEPECEIILPKGYGRVFIRHSDYLSAMDTPDFRCRWEIPVNSFKLPFKKHLIKLS